MAKGRNLLILVPLVAALACSSPPPDDLGYVAQIEAQRAAKDRQFGDPGNDPGIPSDRQQDYLPIPYYPVDLAYDVPAELKLASTRETVEIPTSTGRMRQTRRVGKLEFTLNGEQLSLSAFLEPESGTLFVPFGDETNGTETYPAGRYLDISPTPTGLYEVDFNSAYHPYCYFNPTYDCPIPPRENRLPLEIRAGEKLSDAKRAELNPAG